MFTLGDPSRFEGESIEGVYRAGMLGTGGVPEYRARRARISGVPDGVGEPESKAGRELRMLTGLDGEDMGE